MNQHPTPEQVVDRFNTRHKVGDFVRYFETLEDKSGRVHRIRTAAQVLSGHTAVVWLEGKSGCVACLHCFPLNHEEQAEAQAHADLIEATAKALELAADDHRKAQGYTGSPVHRPAFWWALANALQRQGLLANPNPPKTLAELLEARRAELVHGLTRPQPESVVASCQRQIEACETLTSQLPR